MTAKTPPALLNIEVGSEVLPLQVQFEKRSFVRIAIHPDKAIVVQAPDGYTEQAVLESVRKKARWILKQRAYFDQFLTSPPDKRYVSGESLYYLGRQYRLKVEKGAIEHACAVGRRINVTTENPANTERVRDLVWDWYKKQAKRVFQERLDRCFLSAKRYQIAYPALSVRKMSRRWGSCDGTPKLLLNLDLIKAPVHCIDYVIMHELCHQMHSTHNKGFYKLLERLMPDWQLRKQRLEEGLFLMRSTRPTV